MLPSTVTVYKSRRTWLPSGFKAVMFVSLRKFYVFLQTRVPGLLDTVVKIQS